MTKAAWNERLKLLAGLFQSIATSGMGIGVLAPLATVLYSPRVLAPGVNLETGTVTWILGAGTCHLVAHILLGRLRD